MELVRRALPSPSDRYELGSSKMRVSPFCMGMVEDPDTILAAYDLGVNFFFVSCDMHWPLYDKTREGLSRLFARGSDVRDSCVVAACSYVAAPEFSYYPFLELLDAVPGLVRVDMQIVGGAHKGDFLNRLSAMRESARGRRLGVSLYGTTFHDRETCLMATRACAVDVAYVRYNAGHPGAEEDVFSQLGEGPRSRLYAFKAADAFVSLPRMGELGLGPSYWQPNFGDLYRFALSQPAVDGLLCAPATVEQLHELARAIEAGPLSIEELLYMKNLSALDHGRAALVSE